MKSSKIKYSSLTKELTLSIFSLVVICLFMGFSFSTEGQGIQSGKIFTSSHVTFSDEYNCDYFTTGNPGSPLHSIKKTGHNNHKCTLDNFEEDLDISRGFPGTITVIDNNFVNFDSDKTTRNIFIKQLELETKVPTEKALRSDILII